MERVLGLDGGADSRCGGLVDPGGGDRVYRCLRELIIGGQLAPGSSIIENDLVLRLEVSRTPIRSAIRRLQLEGVLIARGRRGRRRLVVAPLTWPDARELFDLVATVEGLAAREAARGTRVARELLAADLESLRDELWSLARSATSTARALFAVDMKFHQRYMEAGAGERLIALHRSIKPQAERYIQYYTESITDEMKRSVKDYASITEQIVRGEAGGSRRAVWRSWRHRSARIKRLIATKGERGTW